MHIEMFSLHPLPVDFYQEDMKQTGTLELVYDIFTTVQVRLRLESVTEEV